MKQLTQRLLRSVRSWLGGAGRRKVWNREDWEAGFVELSTADREPTTHELIAGYRDTAYFCANLNARGVARVPLRLFVRTARGEAAPRCTTRVVGRKRLSQLVSSARLRAACGKGAHVEEVVEHPLLELLRQPCTDSGVSLLDQFSLFELTQLYQELAGRAYWYIDQDGLGVPRSIWIVPPQSVTAVREPGSDRIIDHYEIVSKARRLRVSPHRVIDFRMPDPADPYTGGLSPLRAAFERASVTRKYLSQTQSFLDNRARPDAIISPTDTGGCIGEAERKRLAAAFKDKFQGAGTGGVLFSEGSVRIEPLSFNPKDLGELADSQASFEHIARAFDIPLSLLYRNANRASAEQGRLQHAKDAILPRITRIAEQINCRLAPLFDPSGRLFVAFDDPVPENVELELRIRESNLRLGVTTIDEERAELGLEPMKRL